ncbi:MAG: helix-turn-helix domain-containing protein [Kiritimatiellae bacterium]|nr:helix-turn-helix domain-containing protein [Kiritimatiellia bacterium]
MTLRKRRKMQQDFMKAAGPNTAAFRALMDTLPDVCFYMKDLDCRIMALNRRNCEVCNIKNELDVIGKRSDEVFAPAEAESFMALDLEVQSSRKPVINRVETHPADKSPGFTISSVYPVKNRLGDIIGTMRLYRIATSHDSQPEWHGRMKKVTSYIQSHYMEEIPLSLLAKMTGCSVSQFKRIFTRTLEMSPGRYIINTRLNVARSLLETTNRLLSDIAQESGFYDQSHMTRAFKTIRQTTPGKYRREHRAITGKDIPASDR